MILNAHGQSLGFLRVALLADDVFEDLQDLNVNQVVLFAHLFRLFGRRTSGRAHQDDTLRPASALRILKFENAGNLFENERLLFSAVKLSDQTLAHLLHSGHVDIVFTNCSRSDPHRFVL